ncbi:aminotransferase class I/II-fold pyridoxal phosphate-dependent enzyme [Candidatus Providencia siddallii]|uniref:8-amino-7-oxononanoate synthase n=1 Tax=Candidatus Providencia siddallii TaxID=1715285 RepID=A0ABP1CD91_9GAMM
MNWENFLKTNIQKRKLTSIWRERFCIDKSNSRTVSFQGKTYLNFSSNDYLGISHNKNVIDTWKSSVNKYGIGSCSSGHVIGYTAAHRNLEYELAEWLGYSNSLLFISGFAANQSVITSLMNKNDRIFLDKLSHASIVEACIFSNSKFRRFQHNNPFSLKHMIQNSSLGKTLVVTEGVFSMDGDIAPIDQLYNITNEYRAWLMIDDAHGIGVIGKDGRGSSDIFNIKPEILIVTFGKAFGLSGAAVLCNKDTANFLIQYARHLIYSTSMPPAQAETLSEIIRQIKNSDFARAKLSYNIKYFRNNFNLKNIKLSKSVTAIQPLIIGNNDQCLQLSKFLRDKKSIWVQSIRPPTVPLNSSRIRITLSALHQKKDIDALLEALNDFVFVS